MKKTRAFALFISFILILGIVLAAEYTGTLGPDQNTDVAFEGTVQTEGDAYLANGVSCTADSQCNSGHCAADYDGDGNWCATANYCAHNGTVTYANGSTTCYGNYKETCTDGNWVATLCSASCENGECTGGTVCGDGTCESGETCSSCPSDCGTCPSEEAISGGGAAPGGGPRPTPTPTPTPTPEEEYTKETIVEQTEEYTPSEEEIGESLVVVGVTEPEEIEKTIEQMGELSIKKTLEVEKKTHIETGEESFESSVSISVTNTGESLFTGGTAYELIPKELVSDSGMIFSEQPFTIEETDDYWIVKWNYEELAPGKTATFTYSVDFELSDEILKKSSSLFSAERKEVPPEEIYGRIVVNVLFEGVSQEGILVSLFKEDVKIAEGTSDATGRVEFDSLRAGTYYVISQATDRFNSERSATIELKVRETKTVDLSLSVKVIVTPTPTPVPVKVPWQWIGLAIMLILLVVVGYFFREQLLELFAGKKPKGLAGAVKKMEKMEKEKTKRPFKKFREEREKKEEPKEKPKKTERKVFKCGVCGEEFHTEIALKAHKRRHKH